MKEGKIEKKLPRGRKRMIMLDDIRQEWAHLSLKRDAENWEFLERSGLRNLP